jgi:hypothetical protein
MKRPDPPRRPLTQTSIDSHCAVCGCDWRSPFPLPLPMSRAVVALRGIIAAGCPGCGATGRAVLLGAGPKPKG